MNEWQVFLNALQFYTRIPLGNLVEFTPKRMENSVRYFPFIGVIIGITVGGVISILSSDFGNSTATIIGLTIGVLLTGALHEDGFADCCDGFGGGRSKEMILKIMKDSSIGAYGAIGLILLFLLKISLLIRITELTGSLELILILVVVQVLSRSGSVSLMIFLDYARTDGNSKSHVIAKHLSPLNTIVIILYGLLSVLTLAGYSGNYWAYILIPVSISVVYFSGIYFKNRIEGYTGDCLGAVQQLCEPVFYAAIVFLWN